MQTNPAAEQNKNTKGPFHQRQLTLTVGFLRTLTSS